MKIDTKDLIKDLINRRMTIVKHLCEQDLNNETLLQLAHQLRYVSNSIKALEEMG